MSATLDAEIAAPHHLLVVADDVTDDEVEALALSRFDGAGWVDDAGHRVLWLGSAAMLTGPWVCPADVRATLDLPPWAARAYLTRVTPDRSAPPPPELSRLGDLLEAFPGGHPQGVERDVLDFLLAAARRLAGAVRLAPGPVLVPDADSAVDLAVHAPVWLDPPALERVLAETLPGLDVLPEPGTTAPPTWLGAAAEAGLPTLDPAERARIQEALDGVDAAARATGDVLDGYSALWRSTSSPDAVVVTVEGAEVVPPAVRFAPWTAAGVISYELRWQADDDVRRGGRLSLLDRERRAAVAVRMERAAAALHDAVGGEVLDEDGFLVDPQTLGGDGEGDAS
ncbi:hypothetical protein Bcav_3822 [Beutenbergia cavernae DSM 12333]|uniref:Uncharacterized protein n=1 Tax=Beutenbergia cavernae (strain ATCC BAA-8 / DSM 12333 / CCUG 43141 / JCM 11478 / NBRC 16432 / NCIMB 13614 / HKI 0122) TaxID=471853 RepID=C5C4E0_BEUC1|nr:hypothetical protein [Beutenbergia cavernae]ACQ82064.1 hypothetical protein Bcav_3822 [Beutenbergia cavernae DSM 12333]